METLEVQTERKTQLVDVTAQVRAAVAGASGRVVTLFVPHTTAGVAVQAAGEGATEVAADIEAAMERLVVEGWPWRHTSEGDRNPWSHVRAVLTASSLTLPLVDGELALGRLQAIFLCEFDGPRTRSIQLVVH
jgi:secondary thiamine-phosphate synthase enzyme